MVPVGSGGSSTVVLLLRIRSLTRSGTASGTVTVLVLTGMA